MSAPVATTTSTPEPSSTFIQKLSMLFDPLLTLVTSIMPARFTTNSAAAPLNASPSSPISNTITFRDPFTGGPIPNYFTSEDDSDHDTSPGDDQVSSSSLSTPTSSSSSYDSDCDSSSSSSDSDCSNNSGNDAPAQPPQPPQPRRGAISSAILSAIPPPPLSHFQRRQDHPEALEASIAQQDLDIKRTQAQLDTLGAHIRHLDRSVRGRAAARRRSHAALARARATFGPREDAAMERLLDREEDLASVEEGLLGWWGRRLRVVESEPVLFLLVAAEAGRGGLGFGGEGEGGLEVLGWEGETVMEEEGDELYYGPREEGEEGPPCPHNTPVS